MRYAALARSTNTAENTPAQATSTAEVSRPAIRAGPELAHLAPLPLNATTSGDTSRRGARRKICQKHTVTYSPSLLLRQESTAPAASVD